MLSRLEKREDELFIKYDSQNHVAAELEQLYTQIPNRTSESVEVDSPGEESEGPAKRGQASRGSGNSLRAPLTAAYSTLLAERNEFKNRCEALMPESQCTMG